MGDRGQIRIVHTKPEDERGSVYLYSHWGGYGLPGDLVRALEIGSDRLDDPEYLTRIVQDAMTSNSQRNTTGYGIGLSEHSDNEYPVLVVRPSTSFPGGTVSWECENGDECVMPFERFIDLRPQNWDDLRQYEQRMQWQLQREATGQ